MKTLLIAIAFAATAAAPAQTTTAAASATAPEATRLTKARALVESFFPEASREQMLTSMNAAISANMRAGILQSAPLKEVFESKPAARPIFEKFLAEEERYSGQQLSENFPKLLDAMALAYARRFTAQQLDELRTFFATPTGQLYIRESMGILSDPDVAGVQRAMMSDAMNRLPTRMPELVKELRAAGVISASGR